MKFYFYNKWKELKQFARLNNNQNLIYTDLPYSQEKTQTIYLVIHIAHFQHRVIVKLIVIQNGKHTLMICLKLIIPDIIQVKECA